MMLFSFHLVAGTFLTTFGSSMLYGYNLGVLNLPEKHVKKFLISSEVNATETTSTAYYSLATSLYLLGGVIGGILGGFVADRIGRRNGLIANTIFTTSSALIFLSAYMASIPVLLYVGRSIVGISCGMSQTLATIYLTEIAPLKYRGAFGACHQLAILFGLAVSNVITFEEVLGSEKTWLIACVLVAIPALIEALCHWYLPESPRYLYRCGRVEEAKEACRLYDPQYGDENFVREMQKENLQEQIGNRGFRFFEICLPTYTRAMLIGCFIHVAEECSGISVIDSYSKTIMTTAGVEEKLHQYCVLGISALAVVCTAFSLPLLEVCGRRPLVLYSIWLMCICLVGLGISLELQWRLGAEILPPNISSIMSLVWMYAHSTVFSMGIGQVAPMIVGEIFRQGPRGAAYSITQGLQWSLKLGLVFVYPNVEKELKGASFFILAGIILLVGVFFYFILPETKGKPIEEICEILEQPVTCFQ